MGKGDLAMVTAVFRIQCSVLRRFTSIAQLLKPPVRVLRQTCILLTFLSIEHWIRNTALAHDLGTHGVIYVVEETDPIALIHQKLKIMENNGELERRNVELQKKARSSVERPKPVEGVTKASQARVFYFDPTYTVKKDLKDHRGRVFASKGLKLNPLETVSLSQPLLFFDGDDSEQLALVQEKFAQSIKTNSVRVILVRGAPLKLAEELKIPVYFDQGGVLTKKLGIHHVPAVVSQEGLHLRIEEVVLPPSGELIVEGDL